MSESTHNDAPAAEIYERPDDYDLEHEGDDSDARFYGRLLRRLHPARVLEFGCDSGRITLALAAALPNAEIVGVDASRPMLERAARGLAPRTPRDRDRITYLEGDMREWTSPSAAFDVVVIAGRSASHLLTLDDRLRTWHNAFRLLRPGGAFILDVAMPDLATLAESQRVWPRAQVEFDSDTSNGRQQRLSPPQVQALHGARVARSRHRGGQHGRRPRSSGTRIHQALDCGIEENGGCRVHNRQRSADVSLSISHRERWITLAPLPLASRARDRRRRAASFAW